jgi:shikimate kinase
MGLRSIDSIILVGFKHCGKSTLGMMLAKELDVEFYDIDLIMEKMTGLSQRELYEKKGVAGYMQVEEEVCKRLAENFDGKRIVIAAGAALCDNMPAMNYLAEIGDFIYLKQNLDECKKKVADAIKMDKFGKVAVAPAYVMSKNPKNKKEVTKIIDEKFDERNNRYESMASITVYLTDGTKEENFKLILNEL